MKILSAKLVNFRNYTQLSLKIDSMTNVIYGGNAQGKTNFLEGLYYAAFGFPFRTKYDEEVIKFGQTEFLTEVEYENNYGKNKLTVKKYKEQNKNKKVMTFNDNNISVKEHYGLLNVVLFGPDDLQIVKGEPGLRRKFLDMEIAQINKYYYQLLVKYNKLLAQRNKFLKNNKEALKIDWEELNSWDQELAKVAAEIYAIRQENLKKLNGISSEIYHKLTGKKESLEISYVLKRALDSQEQENELNQEKVVDFYLQELKKRQKLDFLRGYTSIGPHRDDLLIKVNNNNLRAFGSQGQQRSAALALKLAEVEFIKENKEEYPVLLLDDVMSELDESRRQQLLRFIDGKVQTFITLNDKKLVDNLVESKYFKVEKGMIKEE
jgi:DNA replication and repair protein RecF